MRSSHGSRGFFGALPGFHAKHVGSDITLTVGRGVTQTALGAEARPIHVLSALAKLKLGKLPLEPPVLLVIIILLVVNYILTFSAKSKIFSQPSYIYLHCFFGPFCCDRILQCDESFDFDLFYLVLQVVYRNGDDHQSPTVQL